MVGGVEGVGGGLMMQLSYVTAADADVLKRVLG